jgi:nicotinamidase-related amidase
MARQGLVEPLGRGTAHLCIDMQRLFAPGSAWGMEWMPRILPAIVELAAAHPGATIFTRFVPPPTAESAHGMWRRYYRRWENVTLSRMPAGEIDLVPELARFAPPATVLDKAVYSPWTEGRLDALVQATGIRTVVVTGGETDICVLAAILGAVDRGLRVVLVDDAICSSSDDTHEALMRLYRHRFSHQVEIAETEEVLSAWRKET